MTTKTTKLGGSGSSPGPNISPMAAGGDAPAVPALKRMINNLPPDKRDKFLDRFCGQMAFAIVKTLEPTWLVQR